MGFADNFTDKRLPSLPEIRFRGKTPDIIVVIPCFSEPDVANVLNSLKKAAIESVKVDVFVVVNSPANSDREVLTRNRRTFRELQEWSNLNSCSFFNVYPFFYGDLPEKDFGVGLARRIGMDLAVYRFNLTDKRDGVIVSLDADCDCDRNYFSEIYRCFRDEAINGCSIYFEHPLQGESYSPAIYKAIAQYELYLRYYVQALRSAGFPFAFHTIGSAFAVRASAYVQQGGMNKRKGGEDFYFLQKIIQQGGYTEINSTRVIPSPRISSRVPFGTGPAMKRLCNGKEDVLRTYPYSGFAELKNLIEISDRFYMADRYETEKILNELPLCIRSFLIDNRLAEAIEEMNANSSSLRTFKRRFFAWINSLRVLKFLNYAQNSCYSRVPVTSAAAGLAERLGFSLTGRNNAKELLEIYRKLQRETREWGAGQK